MPPESLARVGVLFLWALRWWKSIQKCKPPSFFLTSRAALYQAPLLGHMVPTSSISHKWLQTSSTKGRGICLNYSLKGVSSVTLITYLVEWMQPSSIGSNEKTSWYLAKSCQVESSNSGGHDYKPLKSSSVPLSLSNSQLRCVRVLRSICPLQQLSLSWWFGLHSCGYCPGH